MPIASEVSESIGPSLSVTVLLLLRLVLGGVVGPGVDHPSLVLLAWIIIMSLGDEGRGDVTSSLPSLRGVCPR